MNFLGRVLLFLLTLLLIVVLTVFLLSPATIGNWTGNISEISPVIRVVVAALIVLVLLALLISQLRPERQPASSGLMMRSSGTLTEVSIDSARERILKAVGEVADVVLVEAQVKAVRGRADLDLDVEVMGDDVRLPDKQKEIDRALRQVINKQLGLQLAGRPRVRIRLHGEKPVVAPLTRIEPPAARSLPPVVPLPQPERTQSGAIGGDMQPDREAGILTERPAPLSMPAQVEPKPEPREGLFSGLFRRERADEPEVVVRPLQPESDKDEMFPDTPELAALLRTPGLVEPERGDSPVAAAAGVEAAEDAEAEIEQLDLDRELASAAADDLGDDQPAKPKDDDVRPASADADEPRQS